MGKVWNYYLGFNPKNRLKKGFRDSVFQRKTEGKQVTLQHTEHFNRHKHDIIPVIKTTIGDKEIIYGEHSLMVRMPGHLKRHTDDIDVMSPTPLKDAVQAEKKLDKFFGGDFFYVKKAEHLGTYKVVAKANEQGYADFTKMPHNMPSETIGSYRYSTIRTEKLNRMRSLRDDSFKFRHGKDRDALNRIRILEKLNKRGSL